MSFLEATEMVGWALAGGAAVELYGHYVIRSEVEVPEHLRTKRYWIITIGMIVAGGVLALLHIRSGADVNPYMAFNIGASAPLAIQALGRTVPNPEFESVY